MTRRQRLASLLSQTGVVRAALALRSSVSTQSLTVLTYHRFPNAHGPELFDDDVVDVTPEAFERQIICLKRHFTFVGVDELCAFAAGKNIPQNSIAVTFDDGYLDNYEQALPILQRHGARATFFLSTAYIDERRIYWWDRVSYIVKRSSVPTISLDYPYRVDIPLGDRNLANERVQRIVKTHPSLELERFLEQFARAAGVAWSRKLERSFADRLLLTWDHVRELKRAGMDIESHTRTHRVLQTLAPLEIEDELAGSRADLERELGQRSRAVAYPVGNPLVDSSPIRKAVHDAGYEIGLSNCTGSNLLREPIDRFNIRRQSVGLNLSEDYLLAMVTLPSLAPKGQTVPL